MTTYYDHHGPGPSTYEYRGDPAVDENAMRRTITRGSHPSHASTKSWVQSHQVNPPLPPDELDDETYSPLRRPRPLPDPQTQHYSPPRPVRLLERLEDDDMYMHTNLNPNPLDAPFGYQNESGMGGSRPIDMNSPTFTASSPIISPMPQPRTKRGFGGFFSGLKRLPKMLGGGGGGNKGRAKGKGRLVHKGTFGTEGTSTTLTAIAITRGNTLPRYLSNPSIGPSNPQFAHRLSMAVANGSLPPEATPAVFQVRNIPDEPRPPVVTVTAPSLDEEADFYGDEAPANDMSDPRPYPEDLQERTTVMVYSDSQAPTVTQAPTQPVIPTRPPTPSAQVVPHPPTMRVSYPVELPTRANAQAQTEPPLVPTPTPVRPILSPQRAVTSIMSPRSILSPPTSNYTISAAPSFYGRSFESDLSPVEKFFKGLYHLPWVAHERVTVDYRPGDSDRAKNKVKGGVKKPMASWYRSVMSRSRRASLDLLSSGNNTLSDAARTSLGTSLSPLGSPISRGSRRSGGSSNRHRTQHATKQGKKKARRRTTSTTTTTTATQQVLGRKQSSPIIPTMYPYTYPGYPYAYQPYGTFPGPSMHQVQAAPSSPRGPRHRKSHAKVAKYPHGGYAQYQPMAMPAPPAMSMPSAPPIYVIAPSPPQSNGGDTAAQQGGASKGGGENGGGTVQYIPTQGPMQQISPVLMHYVPGGYNVNVNQNGQMISPPLTPQRLAAYGSS